MNEIVCISPVDGCGVARRPVASESEIAAALAAARKAQQQAVTLAERKAKMLAFLEALRAQNDQIVPELAMQMGRPVRYGGELRSLEERVRGLVRLSDEALAPVIPEERPGFRRMIKRMPAGMVLVIAPWNYPYLTAVNAIVPALLAGNAVILKHAAQTLLVGERFQAAMDSICLPKGLFTTLTLDHAATERLISSRSVDQVDFTGSVAGERAVERAAAGTFIGLGLELGGKDPAYVRPDARLDVTVEQLVDGGFYNSGQCCCGIERIYVHEQLYDRFVDGFVALASAYRLGNPLAHDTTLGPMAAIRFADTVRAHTTEAIEKCARPLIDAKRFPDDSGHGLCDAAGPCRRRSFHARDDGGELRPGGRHHESHLRRGGDRTDERQRLWPDGIGLDRRRRRGRTDRRPHRHRYGFHEPLRLCRPGLAWTRVKDTGRGASMSRLGFEALTRP